MRKLIISAFIFMFSSLVHAQHVSRTKVDSHLRPPKQLHLNPLVGVSSATFSTSDERSLGMMAGALLNFGKGSFVVETGGLFIQQGGGVSSKRFPIGLNYVAAPVFAKYTLQGDEGADLHLRAGTIPEFLIATSGGVGEITRRVDVLAAAGLGAGFAFNSSTITVDAIYGRGLMRLNEAGSPVYNQTLTVAGGVLF